MLSRLQSAPLPLNNGNFLRQNVKIYTACPEKLLKPFSVLSHQCLSTGSKLYLQRREKKRRLFSLFLSTKRVEGRGGVRAQRIYPLKNVVVVDELPQTTRLKYYVFLLHLTNIFFNSDYSLSNYVYVCIVIHNIHIQSLSSRIRKKVNKQNRYSRCSFAVLLKCELMLLKSKINTKKSTNIFLGN